MAYDWDGKRTRRSQILKFMGALAIPALLFGSAMAALEWTYTESSTLRAAHLNKFPAKLQMFNQTRHRQPLAFPSIHYAVPNAQGENVS